MKLWIDKGVKGIRDNYYFWILSFRDSLGEWIINFLFSTSPMWLSAISLSVDDKSDSSVAKIFLQKLPLTFSKGELFSYSIAALAPVVYISSRLSSAELYKIRLTLLFTSIFLALICSVLISLDVKSDLGSTAMIYFSYIIFCLCFFLLFVGIYINNLSAYKNERLSPNDIAKSDSKLIAPVESPSFTVSVTTVTTTNQ